MKINIRRGANQIGGSAVEITADNGGRIILDLGMPLDATENTPDLLPDIAGLRNKTDDLLGIFISHYHQDHFALCEHIDKKIPIFMTREAQKIITGTADYTNRARMACPEIGLPHRYDFSENIIVPITPNRPIRKGPFTITPYSVDHAADDSVAFLIEANNQRVFYTGDFRAHGRKADKTQYLFDTPPSDIDVLLMEGSCLERLTADQNFKTEDQISDEMYNVFMKTKGLGIVHASSQNIDRLVSIYKAAQKAGRTMVVTGYSLYILMCANQKNKFTGIKKLATDATKPHEITVAEIAKNPGKYVFLAGPGALASLVQAGTIGPESAYIYSMWSGYKEDFAKPVIELIQQHNVPEFDIHTSGHADIPTLRKMVKSLNPTRLVPIHTPQPAQYPELFGDICPVEIHPDNEEFPTTAIARYLSDKFIWDLKTGILQPLLESVNHNRDDLTLQIRRNFITIYFQSERVVELRYKPNLGVYAGTFDSNYCRATGENADCKNIIKTRSDCVEVVKTFEQRKHLIIEKYNNGKKTAQEKAMQQELFTAHRAGNLIVIDTEVQIPTNICNELYKNNHKPRFDMVGWHKLENGKYRPIFIENKFGNKVILMGDASILEHARDMTAFIQSEYCNSYINEMVKQTRQLQDLGLIEIEPDFQVEFGNPEIMFIWDKCPLTHEKISDWYKTVCSGVNVCDIPISFLYSPDMQTKNFTEIK